MEKILIVYSVKGTSKDDLKKAEQAIENFKREGSTVKVTSSIFELPHGVQPGSTLTSELYEELTSSIGAIVFVDDLRPNVAYELGFLHGQGRMVLLVTKKDVEDTWLTISDLAGTSLARIDTESLENFVTKYLTRLYDEIAMIELWDSIPIPKKKDNLIKDYSDKIDSIYLTESDFGASLIISEWSGITFEVGRNLTQDAKFFIVIRAKKLDSLYTIYFYVKYSDATGKKKKVWIGLSSVKRMANLQEDERLVSSKNATFEWAILTGKFIELFRSSSILGKIKIESLLKIKVRAGSKYDKTSSEIEVGFINIFGIE